MKLILIQRIKYFNLFDFYFIEFIFFYLILNLIIMCQIIGVNKGNKTLKYNDIDNLEDCFDLKVPRKNKIKCCKNI